MNKIIGTEMRCTVGKYKGLSVSVLDNTPHSTELYTCIVNNGTHTATVNLLATELAPLKPKKKELFV